MMVRLTDVLEDMAPTPALAAGAREWVFDAFDDYIDESTAARLMATVQEWRCDVSQVDADTVNEADRYGAMLIDESYGCIILAY